MIIQGIEAVGNTDGVPAFGHLCGCQLRSCRKGNACVTLNVMVGALERSIDEGNVR